MAWASLSVTSLFVSKPLLKVILPNVVFRLSEHFLRDSGIPRSLFIFQFRILSPQSIKLIYKVLCLLAHHSCINNSLLLLISQVLNLKFTLQQRCFEACYSIHKNAVVMLLIGKLLIEAYDLVAE